MKADVLGHQGRENTEPQKRGGRAEPLKPDGSGAMSLFWHLLGEGINSLRLKFLICTRGQHLLQGTT